MKKWLLVVGVIVAMFSIAAAACGGNDDDENAAEQGVEAEAQLCADLAELDVALNAYADIDLDSTRAELEAAQQGVDDAFAKVSASIANVADLRVGDLEAAVQAMDQAVRDVPDDATIADGLASLSDEAEAVNAALSGLLSDAGCA